MSSTQPVASVDPQVEENLRLMNANDDALMAHDMVAFESLHADDVLVYLPGSGSTEPTRGLPIHHKESEAILEAFPDISVINNPYPVQFGAGDWTVGISKMSGTHKGPLRTADGQVIPPTGKSFEVNVVIAIQWRDGQIAQEYVMWDAATLMAQLGLLG